MLKQLRGKGKYLSTTWTNADKQGWCFTCSCDQGVYPIAGSVMRVRTYERAIEKTYFCPRHAKEAAAADQMISREVTANG